MTVTRISSPSESSTIAPKMMLASASQCSAIIPAARLTSCSVMSAGPAMERSTPLAPSIEVSRSGELIAFCADCSARCSPVD